MPIRFGPTELIIILVIVLLLFGPGRIARIAGELGKGIRSFKDSVSSDEGDETTEEKKKKEAD